jgi:uncharacterized protein (TIGR03067 family)
MTARILLPFAAGLLAATIQPAQDAVKTELDKLQGEWTLVSREVKGKKDPDAVVMLTIKGDQWILISNMGKSNATCKIDLSKEPKTIDLDGVGPGGEKSLLLGIYKLEGDTLTLCRATGTTERPKEFKTTEEGGFLTVWKRVGK